MAIAETLAGMPETVPVMPDFCRRSRGFRHSLDAACAALQRLGVAPDRISVRYVGHDGPRDAVVAQRPAARETLDVRSRVVLHVSGTRVVDALPYALRDEAADEVRSHEICGLFDSPLAKLGGYLRGAGDFYTLRADAPVTA